MRPRTHPPRPSSRLRPIRRGIAIAAIAVVGMASCGSSGSDADTDEGSTDATAFCEAVDRYVEAAETADRTAMADALSDSLEDLSGDDQRDVRAYVDALRQAPANDQLDGDGVEAPSTEAAFRATVADTCSDVELPPEAEAPTTTEAPIVQGGGSTDDTGVDGGGMETDSGAGGGMTGG